MNRAVDWFECEEGYPTEKSLAKLRDHEFDFMSARDFLTRQLPVIAEGIGCCSVVVEDGTDKHFGEPVKLVEFHTGGWSGAEDLIYIIGRHFWLQHYHTKWERGGHFYFEVPAKTDLTPKATEG